MKELNRRAAIAGLAMAVGTGAQAKPPKPPEPPPGYLVLTLSCIYPVVFSEETLTIQRMADGERYALYPPRGLLAPKFDVPFDNGAGTIVIKRLPPGHYAATEIFVSTGIFEGRIHFTRSFSIESGQATYLGEFLPTVQMGEMLGIPRPSRFLMTLSDQFKRDMAVASAKLPADIPVLNQAPESPTLVNDLS